MLPLAFAAVTYTPLPTKNPGDPILSSDWNDIVNEINSRKIVKNESIEKSKIYVFKNTKGEIIPIVKRGFISYKILFKNDKQHRNMNGNIWIKDMRGNSRGADVVNFKQYLNKDDYTCLDKLNKFRLIGN